MAEKLYEYEGCIGRLHAFRDNLKERINTWKESHPDGVLKGVKDTILSRNGQKNDPNSVVYEDYSHIYR